MTEIEMYKEKAFLVAETTLQNYLAGVGEYGNDIEAAIYIFMDAGVDIKDHFNLDSSEMMDYFHIVNEDYENDEDYIDLDTIIENKYKL